MIVLLIDGAQWYKKYFSCVFPQYIICSDLKNVGPRPVSVIVSSFFGNDIVAAKQKYPQAYLIFVSGEPNHVHFKGIKTAPHLILDCKDVSNRRWPESKFLYLPFFALHFVERIANQVTDLTKRPTTPAELDAIRKQKTKFCAFMYYHNVAHRNALFHTVSKLVAPVEALGRSCHPNGHAVKTDRHQYEPGRVTFYDTAVKKYQEFKFVICCENELALPGYITEKIINAYLANCIPIYRGASDVSFIFNPKSFINGNDLTDEQLATEIHRIYNNNELYVEMLKQPIFVSHNTSNVCSLPKWFDFGLYASEIRECIKQHEILNAKGPALQQVKKSKIIKKTFVPKQQGLVRSR